jgi:hypothetical protein
MDRFTASHFGIAEGGYAGFPGAEMLIFVPTFTTIHLREALKGRNGQQSPITGLAEKGLRHRTEVAINPVRVVLTLRSLERAEVFDPNGLVYPHPDWRFMATMSAPKEGREVAGYVRTHRETGAPDLCLVFSLTSTIPDEAVFTGQWTGALAALMRYMRRQTIKQFAADLGGSYSATAKWEGLGDARVLSAPSQAKLDEFYAGLSSRQRELFSQIVTAAKAAGESPVEVARRLYPHEQ